jgi:hypothetical protein
MRYKQIRLSCPNCNRVREVQIGPAKELALCSHCKSVIEVPYTDVSSTTRRWLLTFGTAAFGTWIGNMFTPRERRIWDLFRRPVQPLAFAVSDTTRVDDAAQMSTFTLPFRTS